MTIFTYQCLFLLCAVDYTQLLHPYYPRKAQAELALSFSNMYRSTVFHVLSMCHSIPAPPRHSDTLGYLRSTGRRPLSRRQPLSYGSPGGSAVSSTRCESVSAAPGAAPGPPLRTAPASPPGAKPSPAPPRAQDRTGISLSPSPSRRQPQDSGLRLQAIARSARACYSTLHREVRLGVLVRGVWTTCVGRFQSSLPTMDSERLAPTLRFRGDRSECGSKKNDTKAESSGAQRRDACPRHVASSTPM